MTEQSLNLHEVLSEEFERLHGPLGVPNEATTNQEEPSGGQKDLPGLFDEIHKLAGSRSALCISGGGIRSATFALGVVQRLAKFRILQKFDYFSTVSGGGFIGSWLTSWARRHPEGMEGVARDLAASPKNPLDPEPRPLQHLREYSNYLTPRLGLFSGDTWAAVATYLRNLLLNWLILVPVIAGVLAIPRFVVAVLHSPPRGLPMIASFTGAMFVVALTYLACTRPVGTKDVPAAGVQGFDKVTSRLHSNDGFLLCGLLPFLIVAIGITLIWAWRFENLPSFTKFTAAVCVISALGAAIYMGRYYYADLKAARRDDVKEDSSVPRYTLKKGALELGMALVSGLVATVLLYGSTRLFFDEPREWLPLPTLANWTSFPPSIHPGNAEVFATFAVPLFLGILALQAALFVGLSSWFNEDYDREWWSRAGGWVLVTAVVWLVLSAITIWGPVLIYLAPRAFLSLAGISGLFSVLCGKSSKTPGSAAQKADESKTGLALSIALKIAAPVFILCLLAGISLLTSRIILAATDVPLMSSDTAAFYSSGSYQVTTKQNLVQGERPLDGFQRGERVFESRKYPALEKDKLRAIEHLYAVDHATPEQVAWIFLGLLVGPAASWVIGVNTFSLHAFYRNRLIRAYLGASRSTRRPNLFTGFDADDNVAMHKLRPEAFWVHSFSDIDGFVQELAKPEEHSELIQFIEGNLSPGARKRVQASRGNAVEDSLLKELLFGDLNRLIDQQDLKDFQDKTRTYSRIRSVRNRTILDEHLSDYLRPIAAERPLHIVNMALNLVAVAGEKLTWQQRKAESPTGLAWQQRKAESFTVSPLHAGSLDLGYRPSRLYGGPTGISLGTAVAISGAAASPNMGYHTSPTLSFLLTLFNVRLGAWLGNPGEAGAKSYRRRNPRFSLVPLLSEMFGFTTRDHAYVYLSDGGHFDNLGLYEMVLRRCHAIVLIDAGADPSFGFEDLGNAIRKIRIDLGIPIDVHPIDIHPRKEEHPGRQRHIALGRIHYGEVDGNDHLSVAPGEDCKDFHCGRLLYIKPAFYGLDEPRDVYNYAHVSETFPHETTVDQFFSESQFESYRALGAHVMDELLRQAARGRPSSPMDLITLADEFLKNLDEQEGEV